MRAKFLAFSEQLHPAFERLMACEPISNRKRLPRGTPQCGVYLFSEGDSHLYVGRTNRLRARRREHLSGKNNDAPFAFKLARHQTNNIRAKGGPTRKALENDPIFSLAFLAAKLRIAEMEFRWVEEADPLAQCLLEIYVAVALDAQYNDFDNH
jgi:hypothetical protein